MNKLLRAAVWEWGAARRSFSDGDYHRSLIYLSAMFSNLAQVCLRLALVFLKDDNPEGEGE